MRGLFSRRVLFLSPAPVNIFSPLPFKYYPLTTDTTLSSGILSLPQEECNPHKNKMLRTPSTGILNIFSYLNFGRLPSAKARTPSRKSSVAPKEF